MNDKQQKILIGAAIAFVCALIYPPFHFRYPNGVVINLGYGFIFDPPAAILGQTLREGAVTTEVLLVEWVAIAVVAGVLWFLAKTTTREQGVAIKPVEQVNPPPTASDGTSQEANQPTASTENDEYPINPQSFTDQIYEQALCELESGTPSKAIWARALAAANGDDPQARATYIRLRVTQLKATQDAIQ